MPARLILFAATTLILLVVGLRGEQQPPAGSSEVLFDLKPVVEGVYAAVAKPVHKINSNAVVIVLDDGVLVVDAHSKPSAARALMEQIRTTVGKPVKYVVDTHFHWDHAQGNAAYPAAWPQGLEIVAATATRESIEHRGIPRMRREILQLPNEIAGLKTSLSRATEDRQRADIMDRIGQTERYLAELESMPATLPTLTLDRSLILHGQTREVRILWLGLAHTEGDVFVYLPRERFVATGDVLHQWTPYMADGHPFEWIRTLTALEQLEWDSAVGGHGEVMKGKAQLQVWKRYLTDLNAETTRAFTTGATMAQAVTQVSTALVPKYAAYMPPSFANDITGNIQKVYRVVSGQTQ
jgi:glyoxylase-like metal-dependent hydrolase (beta-lactamase superfamily II)